MVKKLLSISLLACGLSHFGQAQLIISEVVDAPLPGGLPKYVELTNVSTSSVDLSLYSIGNYNNGGTNLNNGSSLVLSGFLSAGESYVVSYENGDSPGIGTFFDVYGFNPDNDDLGGFVNGNDVIALFLGPASGDGSDATLVDLYGVIGTDGTGESWEYTDSYAFRNPNVLSASGIFNPSEWTFGGINALETGDDIEELALILANTDPGIHAVIPEPSTLFLLGLGLFILVTLRIVKIKDSDYDPAKISTFAKH
ncbi:MAG: lamin tail domain-containing protein [Verrucomicrobiota bacterium]